MRTSARFVSLFTALSFVLVAPGLAEAGKKKKKKDDGPTEPGWHQQEGWMGSCYMPPDWSGMPAGQKRMEWQTVRDQMIGQWKGNRDDGISFDERAIESAETAMLGKPERIESVAAENYEYCKAAMSGKGGADWGNWVMKLNASLTEGECPSPKMSYKLYDYLSINDEWHIPVQVCKGDRVVVHATDGDYFQLSEGGEWFNAAGDPSDPASGDMPCTIEGCNRGTLIMKFTAINGIEKVMPVGLNTTFTAPDHGRLEVMINDDSLSDNKWKIEGGLEHHTGIEYRPAE
jgi:hypothetical protein